MGVPFKIESTPMHDPWPRYTMVMGAGWVARYLLSSTSSGLAAVEPVT
jgi:hypothetical protein